MSVEVLHADCIDAMREMPDASVDSIVTDPPYGLGFMGKAWDALPPGEEWARECLRVLKPGGYMLAFGGTRTWHRLAVAIEDAGFELRDSIAWMHGQGFPKGKATLKPAFEPVVVGRKKPNVAGAGLLQIEVSRIETTDDLNGGAYKEGRAGRAMAPGGAHRNVAELGGFKQPAGRWPSNVILDVEAAEELDAQSGIQKDGTAVNRNRSADNMTSWYGTRPSAVGEDVGYGGSGGASRFFYVAKASPKERPNVYGIAHPTVKPLKLMRYLVKLVTPEGGTVLEPFAGSGATVEACILEGFDCIAIEREAEYLPLIQHRIDRAGLLNVGATK